VTVHPEEGCAISPPKPVQCKQPVSCTVLRYSVGWQWRMICCQQWWQHSG